MFVVLSPIFVTDTKIIYDYNFVAPLSKEVKQVLQRRGEGQELQWSCKGKRSELIVKI